MRKLGTLIAATAIGLIAGTAPAASITFDSQFEYTGAQPPAGPRPWLRAVFDDNGGTGAVTLTLNGLNLVGDEFVNDWFFNLDPALDPADLNFAVQNTTGTFGTPNVFHRSNAFTTAGNTDFDIQIDFGNGQATDRFGAGDSIQFLITGIPSMTANSFDFFSTPRGLLPFLTAAHIEGIGPSAAGSGWVTVPEPTSLGVVALGAAMLVRRCRRSA
jgi:hypothetical protein